MAAASRRTKYHCVFCQAPISKANLWKVDAYPKQEDAELEAETFRCCMECRGAFFHELLVRLKRDGDGCGKGGYTCVYCERSVGRDGVWTIEAYPSQWNPKAAGEMVRVCRTCIEAFFAWRDEMLANVA